MWKIENPLENRNGKLVIGGVPCIELAEKYDTPVFVTDENRIRENFKRLKNAFEKRYSKFKVHYAIKANNNLSVLRILQSEGCGADASCTGEIMLTKQAGFSPQETLYTGNYNSNQELACACKAGVIVNLDDESILPRLVKQGKPEVLSFRINPGIGKGGFGLVLGGKDSKFGIPEQRAAKAYSLAKKEGFKRFGIHMMTGSNILDAEYFGKITGKLLDIAGKIKKETAIDFEFVDIGGGFGVPYQPQEAKLDIERVAEEVTKKFKEKTTEHSLGQPRLLVEPGRYLVCDSTILLTKVHSTKQSQNKYVGIDAGMNTLLRPALYNAYHHILAANKLNQEEKETVNVCGQVCENTDILAKNRELPKLETGDLLALLNAGAYGFSMSSQYNSRPRGAEVLVKNAESFLIRKRETDQDLLLHQQVPEHLK
ncbi:MAG: diaminopimelate decarboxylase [Candidatus Micrarchaeia archaeon]